MAEETTAGTGKDESQDRKVFVPSGRPIRDGLREMKIAEIQPEERIIHGLLRRSLKRWELWGGTRKLALALFVGFVLWLLYHYLGLLVPIMVSILLFLVIPYEYFEADAEDRKDVIRVRVYRPEGRTVPVDVSLSKDRRLTVDVFRPSQEDMSHGMKRKKYEEYYFSRRLLDPTHPYGINTPHCRVIDTGYAKYIFAVEVDVQARTVVGEEDLFPGMAMIQLCEESISYINAGLKDVEQGMEKGKISPEDGRVMVRMAEIARTTFHTFITYANSKGVDFLRIKDLNKAEQEFVFFMDRLSSGFFREFKDMQDWNSRSPSMRFASVQAVENMKIELMQKHKYYQAYEKDLRLDEWSSALDYYAETSGASVGAKKAEQAERAKQMREFSPKEEADRTREEVVKND